MTGRDAFAERRLFLQAVAASALAGSMPRAFAADAAEPPTIEQRMQAAEAAAPLSMQFHGSTADDARQWQAAFESKLRALLGPIDPPVKWDCVLERRVELSDHVREERLLKSDGLDPVPFHLLLPRSTTSDRRPAVLAIHGHCEFAHDGIAGIDDTAERKAEIEKFKWDYGRKLVERGYVVAAPCLTPFGRRLGGDKKTRRMDPCTLVNLQLEQLGKLLISENLRDVLWTLEFLARHERVDAERMGCVGLSLGGRMTTLAAAVDPRIKVAVIAGALNLLQERAMVGKIAGCQVIPGMLEYGDIPEIAGLIAPRRCLWQIGSTDQGMPEEWIQKGLARLEPIYAAYGAADRVALDRFDGGHEWHEAGAQSVLDAELRP